MIQVENLSKSFIRKRRNPGFLSAAKALVRPDYQAFHALTDVSFQIDSGEIVGYIGPNGAGKSTTLKILTGILHPTSGTCQVDGKVPWIDRQDYVKNIGVVFGQRTQLWWDLPVMDSFEVLKAIYGLDSNTYQDQVSKLSKHLGLEDLLQVPVRQLSLGQRMRCELAASLLHRPQYLFLDEPTIGLDAVSKRAVRDFIQTVHQEEGMTVLLTTHDMQDVEALCSRILLIGKGQVLMDGSLSKLKQKAGQSSPWQITYRDGDLPSHSALRVLDDAPGQMTINLDVAKMKVQDFFQFVSQHLEIDGIQQIAPSLEDIVLDLYKEHQL